MTKCGHKFHLPCFYTYHKKKGECPICRNKSKIELDYYKSEYNIVIPIEVPVPVSINVNTNNTNNTNSVNIQQTDQINEVIPPQPDVRLEDDIEQQLDMREVIDDPLICACPRSIQNYVFLVCDDFYQSATIFFTNRGDSCIENNRNFIVDNCCYYNCCEDLYEICDKMLAAIVVFPALLLYFTNSLLNLSIISTQIVFIAMNECNSVLLKYLMTNVIIQTISYLVNQRLYLLFKSDLGDRTNSFFIGVKIWNALMFCVFATLIGLGQYIIINHFVIIHYFEGATFVLAFFLNIIKAYCILFKFIAFGDYMKSDFSLL